MSKFTATRGNVDNVVGPTSSEGRLDTLISRYSARNARIASAVLATAIPSVCPSVRPSVCHTPVLCQNDGT